MRPSPEIWVNVTLSASTCPNLEARNLLAPDYVHLDRQEMHETGDCDLGSLIAASMRQCRRVGAGRVVLDSFDTLFAGIPSEAILRSELRRLFTWLKERELTTVITAERGEKSSTRHGIEEYVSDCVIALDHRVMDDLSTRRLRVVKYRGTSHGTNEYPFLIDEHGITVLPITSLGLRHGASQERLSTGLADLDAMLTGKGYFRGGSIFVTGGPGTGKTTIGAQFADATCCRGERALYFSFEESPNQLVRNMRSAGIELQPWIDKGLLECHASRPSLWGLEMHLAVMIKAIQDFSPTVVIIDPLSSLMASGTGYQSAGMMLRLVDYLKSRNVTALFLSLQDNEVPSQMHVSSIMDTWIVVRNVQTDAEFTRRLHVVKARGMAHSNRVRRMQITDRGVRLTDLSPSHDASEEPR